MGRMGSILLILISHQSPCSSFGLHSSEKDAKEEDTAIPNLGHISDICHKSLTSCLPIAILYTFINSRLTFTATIISKMNGVTHGLWIGARDIAAAGTTAELAWADNTKFTNDRNWIVGEADLRSPQPIHMREKVRINVTMSTLASVQEVRRAHAKHISL